MKYNLGQLAAQLNAEIGGNKECNIERLATFEGAGKGDITFVSDKKLLHRLEECKASAIVLPLSCKEKYQGDALFMENPYVGYALLARIFDLTPKLEAKIAPTAVISKSAKIGRNVAIAEHVVIGENVIIKDNCQIFANVVIGEASTLGANTIIYPNVSIYYATSIGKNCIIHANTVIGSDGFGNAPYNGAWVKIPQIGRVIMGDNVEIGSSTTIDRGALSNTIIEDGVKIDNQCQIAHNVQICKHTAIAGGTCIAGSTKIGKSCIIGGAVSMNGHIEIADHVVITGDTMVVKGIKEAGIYSSGIPAQTNKAWRKTAAYTLKIVDLFKRVKDLEHQIKNRK